MNEIFFVRLSVKRLLQGIESEIAFQRLLDASSPDTPPEDIRHKRDVDEARPGRHVHGVSHPKLVGAAIGCKEAFYESCRSLGVCIDDRGLLVLAASNNAAEAHSSH